MTLARADPPPERDPRERQILRLPDGRDLGYAEYGDPNGAPVLVLHGTPVSRLIYRFAHDCARARGLRLIAPDRPGYGLSTPKPDRRLLDCAADNAALADSLGIGAFALAGLSGGAPFAVATAYALQDRLQALALIGPVGPIAEIGGGNAGMGAVQRAVFGAAARSETLAWLMMSGLARLLSQRPDAAYQFIMDRAPPCDRPVLAKPEVRAALMDGLNDGLRCGPSGAARDMHLFGQSWGFRIQDVMVPCVMWQGSDDRTVPAKAAYALADGLPICRLENIPGAGHFWMFDHVDRVFDAVEAAIKA